jgi:hypothetical protein
MDISIRRLLTVVDDKFEEAGRPSDALLRKVAVMAVVGNPHVGRYVENLEPLIEASRGIAARMAKVALAAMGPHDVQAYGKGGIVGVAGEQEHANALLTTTFAEPFREAMGGASAWISSMTKVAAPGTLIDVPINAITDVYVRSHYDGMTLVMPGAPLPDEIVLIFCMANRGRLNARVGGLQYAESVRALTAQAT